MKFFDLFIYVELHQIAIFSERIQFDKPIKA